MLKKIQKVEKALIDAGIDYDFSVSYDSRAELETYILEWSLDGRRVIYIEDEEGFTSFKIYNPSVSGVIATIERKGL